MKPPGKYVDHPQELVILLNKLNFTMEGGIWHDLTINYYDFWEVNHHLFKCLNHQKWKYHPKIVAGILLKLNPIPLNTVYQASKILASVLGHIGNWIPDAYSYPLYIFTDPTPLKANMEVMEA